jgi:protease I
MKRIVLSAAVLLFTCAMAYGGESAMGSGGSKILMIIAHDNYRDEELEVPLQAFKSNGMDVKIASTSLNPARGMLGGSARPDILLGDVDIDAFDAVIFVGGSGASCYWSDKKAHEIARAVLARNKILGAICIAPVTLANAGVLDGKKTAVWPSEGKRLKAKGAVLSAAGVEIDGNIITASGPASAQAFADAIISRLKKE